MGKPGESAKGVASRRGRLWNVRRSIAGEGRAAPLVSRQARWVHGKLRPALWSLQRLGAIYGCARGIWAMLCLAMMVARE